MTEIINDSSGAFANNIMWKMIDLISRKVFGFAISILLARLLMPEDYGIIALTIVFIAFTNVFILNGFNVALIRKKNVKSIDYSTVLTMSISFVAFVNLIIFFSAPVIADFYKNKELCPVLRAMVLGLFFSAISAVVSAKATRELKFRKMAIPSFCSNALGGIVAVIMAYMGLGVWALVFQHLVASFVGMIWYIIIFDFPLSLKFSGGVVKELYRFTLGVIGTSLLEFLGNHVCSLIIGKTYNSKGLGHYDRSIVFPEMISANISGAISNVLLPTLAQNQNNLDIIKQKTRKTLSLTMFIIIPIMFVMIGSSQVLVPVVLTEKWIPIIPLLCICSLFYSISPIRSIEYSVLFALGKSKYSSQSESMRALLMIVGIIFISLILEAPLIMVVIVNLIVCAIVTLYIHNFIRKLIGYSYKELIEDLLPTIFMSTIIMILVFGIGQIFEPSLMVLISQILIGIVSIILLSWVCRNQNFIYLKNLFKLYIPNFIEKNEKDINYI